MGEIETSQHPGTASEWLVALRERPDDESLRAAFDEWLGMSPANARDWAEVRHTYALLGAVQPPVAEEAMDDSTSHRCGRRHWGGPVAALAASLVVVWIVAVVVPNMLVRFNADYTTGTAETRLIELDDGSHARLGPQSAVAVSMSDHERSIVVLAGRVFFDVMHDPERPFRVSGASIKATALGTAFEVRVDDAGVLVAVRDGHVRVRATRSELPLSETLDAGGVVRLANDGSVARDRMPPELVAAWREGVLVAKDLPVARAVDELRQYFRGVVVLRGAGLAAQPVTGIYDLSEPATALRAIAAVQDAVVYRLSPWLLIVSGS